MKKIGYLFLLFLFVKCSSSKNATAGTQNVSAGRNYYTLQVYHISTPDQLSLVENFLKTAYLPALHRQGIATIGVFKPIENDTAADKRIIVFTPYKTLEQFEQT